MSEETVGDFMDRVKALGRLSYQGMTFQYWRAWDIDPETSEWRAVK